MNIYDAYVSFLQKFTYDSSNKNQLFDVMKVPIAIQLLCNITAKNMNKGVMLQDRIWMLLRTQVQDELSCSRYENSLLPLFCIVVARNERVRMKDTCQLTREA